MSWATFTLCVCVRMCYFAAGMCIPVNRGEYAHTRRHAMASSIDMKDFPSSSTQGVPVTMLPRTERVVLHSAKDGMLPCLVMMSQPPVLLRARDDAWAWS